MPNTHNTKNFMAPGGDELVIGGKLTLLSGATVDDQSGSLSGGSYTLPAADATTLGGVKAKKKSTESVEVAIDSSTKKLYVPALVAATEEALGGIKAKTKDTESVEVAIDGESSKLYVPALAAATEAALGGIKAKAKTSESVEVAIDGESNKLYVPAYPTNATTEKEGLVKQAAAVEDAATDTASDLKDKINALLKALRDAGVLKTSD